MEALSVWQAEHRWQGFPPLAGEARAEVAVVGAGVTGVSCAWRLREHGRSVAVLEAREAAAGASGRNGGFAVAGSALAFDEAVERLGREAAASLQRATQGALDEMVARAADLGAPQALRRQGSLWLADAAEAGRLRTIASLLSEAGFACELAPERIPEPMRPFYETAAFEPGDCALQPALFVRTLAAGAVGRGAVLYERSPVERIEPDGSGWVLATPAGTLRADAVVVACDGLVPRLCPALRGAVFPVRGQVLLTAPAARAPLSCPTHSDGGFMYYRPLEDGRIALGGGRQAALAAEFTDVEETSEPVQAALERFLTERLGLAGMTIQRRWAGIMGFSADGLPVAGELPGSPGLFACGGYSGVGNVQGYLCGALVADLVAGGGHPLAPLYDPRRLAATGEQPGAPVA